ncbi:MAG: tRNA cytidylyltransferase [Gemmatimonadaceae bacterium]|nr:tRNA cytidylyltransferase [Gemmatimonadaceae bacterium]
MSARHPAIRPPDAVLDIVRTLRRAGFDAWCVGGAVRDALLGHAHLDWDLATSATPPQVRRLCERTIPVGIEFGTVGVLDRAGLMHEVTTFRRDVQHDGRHAVVEFGASLDEDLARRDFTINAIAFDPIAGRLHDPYKGRDDLALGIVRAVGEPNARMAEDRLRALRAIRFASRFDFALDASTWHAIVDSAPFLSRLSPERVKQEIEKTMDQVLRPSTAFRRWRDSGAFAAVVPALATVTERVLDSLDCLPIPGPFARPQRRVLRIAALLSDLVPPSSELALRALRFSNQDIQWISALVARWHAEGEALTRVLCSAAGADAQAVRRLAASVGRLRTGPFVRLAAARWGASRLGGDDASLVPPPERVRGLYRRALRSAFNDPIEVADLAVDGDDLRRAGIRPGPQIGATLNRLLEAVLAEPSHNSREWLLAHVASLSSARD